MSAPIDFYFDFSSPYGYVASELIEALAAKHGRTVLWHPMLLGVAFKAIGTAPLPRQPQKRPKSQSRQSPPGPILSGAKNPPHPVTQTPPQ